MNTSIQLPAMNLENFIGYLFLSVADADQDMADKEMTLVKRAIKRLLSRYQLKSIMEIDTMVEMLQDTVKGQSVTEKQEAIGDFSKMFPISIDLKMDILQHIHELIHVDEKIAATEYNMMSHIRMCLLGA